MTSGFDNMEIVGESHINMCKDGVLLKTFL